MKEAARAAEHELAQNRLVAAFEALLGPDHEKVTELKDVRSRRMPLPVAAMEECKVMADIAEGLARDAAKDDPLGESTVQVLADAGFDSIEAVREASDGDLLAIKGIGKAKLEEIREKVG